MSDNCIPASELLQLLAALRDTSATHTDVESIELRNYLRGARQGREQAAERLEELLREYGIDAAETMRFLEESRGGG